MGGGIAQLLAKNNVVCRIKDLNNQALALALKTARDVYKISAEDTSHEKGAGRSADESDITHNDIRRFSER